MPCLSSLAAKMRLSSPSLPLLLPLLLSLATPLHAAVVSVTLNHSAPFSPLLYGVNFATSALLSWGTPANRNGGNAMTNWNWQLDATNSANDWYFLSEPLSSAYPAGSSNDLQMDATFAAGATFITTVSTIGHVTNTRQKVWSFSVAHYGAQQSNECIGDGNQSYCAADAGNGVLLNTTRLHDNLTWYQSYTTSDAIAFVGHMQARATPPVFNPSVILQLDNEPDIWHETHADCHGTPLSYDELWSYTLTYSTALKASYPGIRIAGPIWCCWCAYFWSAKDGCGNGADYAAHGNTYVTPWLLQQLNAHYLQTGVQLIDYLDIHYYPNVPPADSSTSQSKQFTDEVRSFYDPTYVDPGWIGPGGCNTGCNGPYVNLIPRFQGWIAQYAPNLTLPLAISEFSFGSDSQYSATLANAEALSVFAVHGLAYATRWTSPATNTQAENAYKLYLNYDGANSKVLGASQPTTSSTWPTLTAYSVYNVSTQTLFVLLFNLAFSADTAVSVAVSAASMASGASSLTASVYQFSAAAQTLAQQAGITVASSGGKLSFEGYTAPARSATLVVMKGVAQTAAVTPFSSSSSSAASSSSARSSSTPTSSPAVASTQTPSSSTMSSTKTPSSSALSSSAPSSSAAVSRTSSPSSTLSPTFSSSTSPSATSPSSSPAGSPSVSSSSSPSALLPATSSGAEASGNAASLNARSGSTLAFLCIALASVLF